jgi:hypothetical protein
VRDLKVIVYDLKLVDNKNNCDGWIWTQRTKKSNKQNQSRGGGGNHLKVLTPEPLNEQNSQL